MTTRGIFILETVRTRQREGEWVPLDDVYGKDSLQEVGYIVGGQNSSNQSTSNYQTINYSTETKGNISPLPIAKIGVFGTASPSAGYTYGGKSNPSTHYSNIDKLTLSTQTHAALPGANMTAAYSQGGSCGSSTVGYLCGGIGPSEPNGYTRLEKLTYSTETLERIPGANMPSYPSGVWNNSASGDGDNAGYWVGGATQSGSRVNKLTYSNDSWGNLPNLPGLPNLNRNQKAGQASSDTGFYLVGGSNPYSSRVQKVTFASGTNSIVTNSTVPTNNGRMRLTGTGSHSRGYFAGGTETSIVERLQFSTNSMTRLPALDLSQGVQDLGSLSSVADNKALPKATQTFTGKVASFDFGYATGGEQASPYPGSGNTRTFKINYSTDTSARIPSADQNIATRYQFAAGNSSTGYIAGGLSGSVPGDGSESMEKFHYSTDTRGSSPNWGNRRAASFAMTNEGRTHFYGLGGYGQPSSNPKDNGYKMDYATESPSTLPSNANLSISRRAGAPYVTKSNEGYMAGGGAWPSDQRSNVDKIQFGSDTTSRIPGANLPNEVSNNHGTSESSAGYSFGGVRNGTFYSYLYKTTFATDTSENNPASLPALNSKITTMGNPTNAYLAGGWASNPGPGYHMSTLYKYTYSTETFSQLPNLPTVMVSGAGMSAGDDNMPFQAPPVSTPTDGQVVDPGATVPDAGYNMKGNTPGGLTSRISKIAFATDTRSNPGNMPTTGEHSADFSSLTAAYSNTGKQGPSNYTSSAQKITYSTDSASSVPGGQSLTYQRQTAKCATLTHGYLAGGLTPGPYVSNFNKMTFSNETYSLLPAKITTNFSSPSGNTFMIGFNNSTAGYWGTGEGPGNPQGTSSVVKLTFATDTSSANSGNLPTVLKESASLGNGDVAGYTMSGGAPSLPGSGHISYTSKMLYSTDTFSVVPGAYWNPIRYRMTSFSSFVAGYAGMGSSPSDAFSKMPWSTETWSPIPGSWPSGQGDTRDTGGGTSAKSNSGGKPKIPVVL